MEKEAEKGGYTMRRRQGNKNKSPNFSFGVRRFPRTTLHITRLDRAYGGQDLFGRFYICITTLTSINLPPPSPEKKELWL